MARVLLSEKEPFFDSYSDTRVTTMGNITELVTMQRRCLGPPVVRLDKDHFMDFRTGEVCEYKHIENRSESTDSVRRTLAHIRALINTNVMVPENCRWVTLTYADNMTDTKQLYQDFRRFWQRFCYWCKTNGYGKPEYITVQEPQGRGAWHIHAFFIWLCKAPFISNDDVLSKLWGHGFTKIKALGDCDNIGAYFSAYLADMPLEEFHQVSSSSQTSFFENELVCEEKEFANEQGNLKKKKFVKGGRLFFYPPGMNIVRTTKGIKMPVVEKMTYSEAKEKVCSAKQTFSRCYDVLGDDGALLNTICKAYYNSKRKD